MAETGCQVGASASGGLLFPSLRLEEKDEIDLGEFKLGSFTVQDTPRSTSHSCWKKRGRRPPYSPEER